MAEPRNCSAAEPARLFLLIENRLLRETLVRLFRKRSDFCIVGHSSFTEAASQEIGNSLCNVLVLDCLQLIARLSQILQPSQATRGVKVVLIGMEGDEDQFLTAVRFGVTGYLLNDASAGDVVAAVGAVARGEAVCPPRLCLSLFRCVATMAQQAPVPRPGSRPGLTLRQQKLVSLVAQGLTNKEIASHLNLSEYTVKNHIHRILKQVDAATRYEAVETARLRLLQ